MNDTKRSRYFGIPLSQRLVLRVSPTFIDDLDRMAEVMHEQTGLNVSRADVVRVLVEQGFNDNGLFAKPKRRKKK